MRERDIISPVVEYYEGKLAAFGATARGVDWKDESSQRKRFEQLVRALRLDLRKERFSIVDFGCGYGALLPFLAEQGFACEYTGYDRSSDMVAEARRQHGMENAFFTSRWESVPRADFVVASGVFNVRLATPDCEWVEYVKRTLRTLDEKATVGWAANFLTSNADEDRKRADLHYADPPEIFAWCQRSVSRWVSLLHDYDLYEFTVGVTRRPW